MNAELVKRQDRWDLYGEDGSKLASSAPNPFKRLSIKNCESIANGYDLDELADEYATGKSSSDVFKNAHQKDFTKGFQKALSILGDKKFSELDMRIAYDAGCNNIDADDNINFQDTINSLQQTEWDVEVEMVSIPADRAPNGWDISPKIDTNGCLILRRFRTRTYYGN